MMTEKERRQRKELVVEDTTGSVGAVPNDEARAFKQEPRFEGGTNREAIGKRFESIESIPRAGVTKANLDVSDEYAHGSIGVVPDPAARTYGDRIEPAFVGMERRLGGSLNERFFGQAETIPREGVTVPTTPSPSISEGTMTSPPKKADLRDLEGPAVGPTSPGPNVANIYHEAEHDAREKKDKSELQGTSTTGPGPNPAFRRKHGRPVEGEDEDE
jgi:hypothetical protein